MEVDRRQIWLQDALLRIKSIKQNHHQRRVQTELTLETSPKNSRYSAGLVDLMKKEEQMVRDNAMSGAQPLIRKVDELMRNETKQFFAKCAEKHIRKWLSLKEQFEKEDKELRDEIISGLKYHFSQLPKVPSKSSKQRRIPTAKELEAEAQRLESDYNRNWYQYESFNLQEAFQSQTNRVENDWGTHEKQLREEYRQKMEPYAVSNTSSVEQQQDPRWQHPEKQKTLIHTAPVLTPSRQIQSPSHNSKSPMFTRRKDCMLSQLELDRLEQELHTSLGMMQKQKSDALRWLSRQRLRLQTQVSEVQLERQAIADVLDIDSAELSDLMRLLEGAVNAGKKEAERAVVL